MTKVFASYPKDRYTVTPIFVEAVILVHKGYILDVVTAMAEALLKEYLSGTKVGDLVRRVELENIIMSVDGVKGLKVLRIQGLITGDIPIGKEEVARPGSIKVFGQYPA